MKFKEMGNDYDTDFEVSSGTEGSTVVRLCFDNYGVINRLDLTLTEVEKLRDHLNKILEDN